MTAKNLWSFIRNFWWQ